MIAKPYHQGAFLPAFLSWPHLLRSIDPGDAAITRYEGGLRVAERHFAAVA